MNKAEAAYEFISQFAYFACSGIIVMENYTVSDGDIFSELIVYFDMFMEQHRRLTKLVKDGTVTEEAADSILKASIRKLRNSSVKRFFELVDKDVFPNTSGGVERDEAVSTILKKIKDNTVTNEDFITFIETLRLVEECKFKEATP